MQYALRITGIIGSEMFVNKTQGPLRETLRRRKLGYKNVKFIERIVVTGKFTDPAADITSGWLWYTGIWIFAMHG